ncbi:hypothetical protein H257_08625 [Aphanomyces astaci]|uniref:Uncharacterized protein n=1 Tax=Aphanomyces astaci TaxID=112090 RepID=W4GES7_APHAT|nr:hypothetical protein H257_08625 [Aphanomyces astaci]ETV77781.1 hypothetical protein H257_08625 [Aphanomyces astaci]|eukprot:XP_009832891.1 hypothetical protein H257_08625 [Aphanomyces astaci]
MTRLNLHDVASLGDTMMLWLMVPSITSIVVVAAFVIHHIRHHDGGKQVRQNAAADAASSSSHPSATAAHSDHGFGHGLTLRDVANPTATIDFNSRLPIPIDTSLFTGFAYVLLRRPDGDAHWDPHFEGKQRTMWVMVQGTFKRAPEGTVYVCGELPRPMTLTFWSKAFVSMIVTTIKSLLGGSLHFSFGDETELPHLSLPLYQSADTVIATPLDDVPPKLGTSAWREDPAARAERKRTPVGSECFRTDMVYSFQFHTMHVDLASWSLVNLPGVPNVRLTSLMGDMSLRLGVYEHVPDPVATDAMAHVTKHYCFSFDISSTLASPRPMSSATIPEDKLACHDAIEFEAWMWVETFDVTSERRPISYLFRILQEDGTPKTVYVSSAAVASVLASHPGLLTRARLDHYAAIDDQLVEINRLLHIVSTTPHASTAYDRLVDTLRPAASPSALLLPHGLPPKALGVNMWRWDLNVCMEGSGYRIVSDICLRQEYFVLTSASLLLYRTYASQPAVKVSVHDITDVVTRFVHDLHVVAVYTWTEVLYLHVADPMAWKMALLAVTDRNSKLLGLTRSNHKNLSTWSPFNIVTFDGLLVLNHRKIAALDDGGRNEDEAMPSSDVPTDAVAASAQCLHAAVVAATSRHHRAAFQRAVHALRQVDLATFTSHSDTKLVFLLNLYQALLVHTSLVLPFSTTNASMHQCAYEVGNSNQIKLSLAEIEHVLMRAAAPALKDVPYLDFVPDAAAYPSSYAVLALPTRDFRLSCALHVHRTTKCLVAYTVDSVHYQLSEVVRQFLGQHVQVTGRNVTLPVACQWFKPDFGDHILRKIMGLLSCDTVAKVQDLVDHPNGFSVHFRDTSPRRVPSHWTISSPSSLDHHQPSTLSSATA